LLIVFPCLTSAQRFHRVLPNTRLRSQKTMDRASETNSASQPKDTRKMIVDLLSSRNKKARFMTEVYASLERAKIATEETDRILGELETEGAVMIRAHFCADPHLAGVDLRVVALVQSIDGDDPQLSAIRSIDETWNKWLNEYLANHRCG
jgi:hypothetical protein